MSDEISRLDVKVDRLTQSDAETKQKLRQVEERLDKGASLTAAKALDKANAVQLEFTELKHAVHDAEQNYRHDKTTWENKMMTEMESIRREVQQSMSWKEKAQFVVWTVIIAGALGILMMKGMDRLWPDDPAGISAKAKR